MKLNANKTQRMIVSRYHTLDPSPSSLPRLYLRLWEIFFVRNFEHQLIHVLICDSKNWFEDEVQNLEGPIYVGELFEFSYFALRVLCLAWILAADSHLKFLDRNLKACNFFLFPILMLACSTLCMSSKICQYTKHPLHLELPDQFQP